MALDSLMGGVHDVLAAHVSEGKLPGLVALVARGDEVWADAIGVTSVGGDVPVQRDTIFRISSLSKPITAVAACVLVDDGALSLDEPVDKFLPELANRRVLRSLESELDDTVPADRPITTRDLLTFTLGFGLVFAMPGTYPIQRATEELKLGDGPPSPAGMPPPDEWMRRFGSLPLIHQPGERWMYNTGANVLGVLVARASGMPLETFLHGRLFAPLAMKDTAFFVPAAKLERFTPSYFPNWQTGAIELYDEAAGGQWSTPPAFPSGAGGLVSTVDDYLAFARMLLGRGVAAGSGRRILSEASVAEMTRDQLTPEQKAGTEMVPGYWANHGWGFGMSVVTGEGDPAGPPGTFGWDGGMGTPWRSDPARRLTCLLMTPVGWASPQPPPVCVDFWTAVGDALR